MIIEIEKNSSYKNIMKTFNIKSVNYTILTEKMKQITISDTININSMYNEFIGNIEFSINDSTKTKNIITKITFLELWTDTELFQTIATRNLLYKKLKRDPENSRIKIELKIWQNIHKVTWKCINEVLYDGKKEKQQVLMYN